MPFRLFDAPQAEPSQFVGIAGNIIDRHSENRADDSASRKRSPIRLRGCC
jgi:NAD+ diphosphatase